MNVGMYCGEFEFAKLQFTFSLLDEIRLKIQQGILFYETQLFEYAQKRLNHFFHRLSMSPALHHVCKNEMWHTITVKLKGIIEEKRLLRCV
ncbi:hypothetical protein [Bacillus sp. 165]|uniref:hypothetical protein n=1 Tax=Bacillus sp. 165 TaxID=1529117 RepID=UPI001ADCAEDE|nr:hypothetical protein [Bacillus sp. 165]MBO9129236.1 hypothetical protein [Bacillus sp. 165]